ncbi:MAG: AAA family ATPase [Turicibacter sp.]|nr:AAA family ATPase [Turicibacter sp.]
MFLNVHVKNFRSLVDFHFDLAEKKNTAKKLALIYGENGSGKTNVADIFFVLKETFHTMGFVKALEDFFENENMKEVSRDKFRTFRSKVFDLEAVIKEAKTIGTEENLYLKFEFQIYHHIGVYTIEFNEERVIYEKLEYLIEKNRGTYFEIGEDSKYFNPKIFVGKKYLEELSEMTEKFWGKHTFLSLIFFEQIQKNEAYFSKNIHDNFHKITSFFLTFLCSVKAGSGKKRAFIGTTLPLNGDFLKGQVALNKINELDMAEEVLEHIFTNLYPDIKSLYYVRKETDEQAIEYQLYAKKLIGSKIRRIPFQRESTGTRNILNLLSPLLMAMQGTTVILDEFDTGIHDVLIKNIFEELEVAIKGQIIMTTHNTLLLESDVENKYLYILTTDAEGNKELHSLDKYDLRAHKNNNRRAQYLKGMYEGVPSVGQIDFNLIVDQLNDKD